MKPKILVCVGHHSKAMGAKNPETKIHEYQIMRLLAPMIVTALESKGFACSLILDSKLTEKVKETQNIEYALALDLHMNAFNTTASGHLTMHFQGAFQSQIYAKCINEHMTHNKQRTIIVTKNLNERGCYFLKKTKCPAVIIEFGFIDNLTDFSATIFNLSSLAFSVATGIYQGFYTTHNQITMANGTNPERFHHNEL